MIFLDGCLMVLMHFERGPSFEFMKELFDIRIGLIVSILLYIYLRTWDTPPCSAAPL